LTPPNPPPNSGFFLEINWFGDIPDHQQAQPGECREVLQHEGLQEQGSGPARKDFAWIKDPFRVKGIFQADHQLNNLSR